jgi:hypothetical protein
VRFSNDRPSRAFMDRKTSSRLSDANHNMRPSRRRCIPLQNFNSSGPHANLRNGAPFPRTSDHPHRPGGGSPPSKWSRSMKRWKRSCAIDCSSPLVRPYAAGAAVLMATLADQISLPWPDEFPRKTRRDGDARAPSP